MSKVSKVSKPIKKASKVSLDQLFKNKPSLKSPPKNLEIIKDILVKKDKVIMKQNGKDVEFDIDQWYSSLSKDHQTLLNNEFKNINSEWLYLIKDELTKPYFLELKSFLNKETTAKKTIFPLKENIYSFSNYCPNLSKIKVLILGQDPYHNFNQAHGLAFSVLCPKLPPSLINIYKTIKIDYPHFQIPKNNGNLSSWSKQGVLLLNTCLTVEAHKANSHNNKGWETFTSALIKSLINYKNQELNEEILILAWGSFAINLVNKTINLQELNKLNNKHNKVLTSVHPSPLSARRGFFECQHFKKSNDWIKEHYSEKEMIDWTEIAK